MSKLNRMLLAASRHNELEKAKWAIEAGADVNCNKGQPLWEAVKECTTYTHGTIILMLIDKGANVNASMQNDDGSFKSLVQEALESQRFEALDILLKSGKVSKELDVMGFLLKNNSLGLHPQVHEQTLFSLIEWAMSNDNKKLGVELIKFYFTKTNFNDDVETKIDKLAENVGKKTLAGKIQRLN